MRTLVATFEVASFARGRRAGKASKVALQAAPATVPAPAAHATR